jgi:hypothetical protein
VEPLGARRLIEDLRRRGFSPGRGVAIYATPGEFVTTVLAENPMLATPKKHIAAVQARAQAAGIPPVIALVVDTDSVTMYPTSTRGEITGEAVHTWRAGEFTADSRGSLFVRRLLIRPTNGQQVEVETKTPPVGPNRFNSRVTAMIVDMGRHGWAVRTRRCI